MNEPVVGDSRPRRLSRGTRVLIGCLAVAALCVAGIVVVLAAGGVALTRGVRAAAEQVDENEEATRIMADLARDHPWSPPTGARPSAEQHRRFRMVTDDAWSEMGTWAPEARLLMDRQRPRDGATPGLREVVSVTRASTNLLRTRPIVARALQGQRMSIAEYIWIGQATEREGPEALGRLVPGEVDAKFVLDIAAMWAMR